MDEASNDDDRLAEIKATWLSDELHRSEYWADLASRDVPWLIEELEAAYALLYQPRPQGAYRLSLGRAGAESAGPLAYWTIPVGNGFTWESEFVIFDLRPAITLEYFPPTRPS